MSYHVTNKLFMHDFIGPFIYSSTGRFYFLAPAANVSRPRREAEERCRSTVEEKMVVAVIRMYMLLEETRKEVVVMGTVEAVMVVVVMVGVETAVVEMVVAVTEAVVVLQCELKAALLLEVVEICRCKLLGVGESCGQWGMEKEMVVVVIP